MVNAILCWLKNSYLSQKTSLATSSSTSNVISRIPRPGDPRSNPWTLQEALRCSKIQPPGLRPSIADFTFIQVQALDGCVRAENVRHCLEKKRRSSNQSENILASRVNSRNNIHPLQVQRSPTQSMSVNVFQVPSHSQLISNHRPRPLHCRSQNCAPNWCRRPCYLTSRLWPRPDHHEMHSESNLDARNKRVNSSL